MMNNEWKFDHLRKNELDSSNKQNKRNKGD